MNDKVAIEKQYRSSDNLESRIQIYQYSVSVLDWHKWVFDRIPLMDGQNILEIGCGNGELWAKNAVRLPKRLSVLLTDQSSGMLNATKARLSHDTRFSFKKIDIDQAVVLPAKYDTIIANHMLYHVANINHALVAIHASLTDGGTFVASTNSVEHLSELNTIFSKLTEPWKMPLVSRTFNVENGMSILEPFFSSVVLHEFTNTMNIPEPEPIMKFLQSIFNGRGYSDITPQADEIREELMRSMASGSFTLTGRSGLFICRRGGKTS